jgi:hypothetical protein
MGHWVLARTRGNGSGSANPSSTRDRGWERDLESVPSRHFAAVAEREHETSGVDPALDNVLRSETRNTCTDDLG